MGEFLPIGILLIFSLVVSVTIFLLSRLFSLKNPNPVKYTTYECGVKPEGSARAPFRTSFYMVAMLFLLFDVEAAFFFPWALVYKESLAEGGALLLAISIYLGLLVLGLIYIFRKNGLRLRIEESEAAR